MDPTERMRKDESTHMTDTTQQTAPRVTAERIEELFATLRYQAVRIPNTSTTIATAMLPDGFEVARGYGSCVSPATFDAETSEKLAISAAASRARTKLWELEAYHLKRVLEERSQIRAAG